MPCLFKGHLNAKGKAGLRLEILRKAEGSVSHETGLAYENAMIACLKGQFGVEKDDKIESGLAKAFEDRVLKPLQAGRRFDELAW